MTTLTDLRSAVPFTYVEPFSNIVGCSTSPFVWVEWRTIYVSGTAYPANTATITMDETNTMVTYTFSSLYLSDLYPGEVLFMVRSLVVDFNRSRTTQSIGFLHHSTELPPFLHRR